MFDCLAQHNGALDLPIKRTHSGVVVIDASLEQAQDAAYREMLNQVRADAG